jgi:hypothetical protein
MIIVGQSQTGSHVIGQKMHVSQVARPPTHEACARGTLATVMMDNDEQGLATALPFYFSPRFSSSGSTLGSRPAKSR